MRQKLQLNFSLFVLMSTEHSIYLDISVAYTLPAQQIQEQQYNFCCKKVKEEKSIWKNYISSQQQ